MKAKRKIAIDGFRRQHGELCRSLGEISRLLAAGIVKKDPAAAKALVTKLSVRLSIHLDLEDGFLYAALMSRMDGRLKEAVRAFLEETGCIRECLEGYSSRWATEKAIRDDSSGFMQETRNLLYALSRRIEREDSELYGKIQPIGTAA